MFSALATTLVLAGSIVQVSTGGQQHRPDMFKDVDRGHWLYSETGKLADGGVSGFVNIRRGVSKQTWTRYEFAVMMDRAMHMLCDLADGRGRATNGDNPMRLQDLSTYDFVTILRIRRELGLELAELESAPALRKFDKVLADAVLATAKNKRGILAGAPVGDEKPLKDVGTAHWAYSIVEDLNRRRLILGSPDGFFRGKRTMTRHELAAALDRLLKPGGDPPGQPR